MTCMPVEELRSYRRQQLPEEDRRLVEEHLSECRSCRRRLVDDLRREEAAGPETVPDEILARVRGLVDAGSPHSAASSTGGATAVDGARQVLSARTWLPLAAAVLAVVGAWWLVPRPGSEPVLRDVEAVSGRLAPIEPAADAEVEDRVLFRWTAVPEASHYRLVILGVDGARLLERETANAELEIDLGILLSHGGSGTEAYWLVEAQLPGGGRLHTDPRPIELRIPDGPPP